MDNKSTHSKSKMIKDLFILAELWKRNEISNDTINAVLEKYSWYLTEYQSDDRGEYHRAKYQGCPFWSLKALSDWKEGTISPKELRHEHVVPRTILMNSIWKTFCTEESISEEKKHRITQQIIEGFIGCVVTIDEANKLDQNHKITMPYGDSFFDIVEQGLVWGRYKECNIPVYQVIWKREKNRWERIDEKPLIENGQ